MNDYKSDLERLLKELIDKGIIYEWYFNGEGYHWSYTKPKLKQEESDD